MAAPSSNEASVKQWLAHFRYKPERDSPNDIRNSLLVVAALTASATFATGVNPPGGVWQDTRGNFTEPNHHTAGQSVLASHSDASFTMFIFANTAAFSASTLVISFLVYDFPFFLEVWMAMFGMSFTYGVAIQAVSPSKIKSRYVFVALVLPYIIRYSVVEVIKKLRKLKRKECG